ncbi:redox-sensing transcriptional repressor Rex [Planctomycetota bacterium]
MRYHRIPDETVKRLPVYLRGVDHLVRQGQTKVSSKQLAEYLGVFPWQIRKDFSYFGDFGKPGVGYRLDHLDKHIRRILKLNFEHAVALIGVGNLGSALLAYPGFTAYSLRIVAAYDIAKKKIGKTACGIMIEDIANLERLREQKIDLAVLAIPEETAQEITDRLVDVGVRGIVNFSSQHVQVPKKVKVITIDIAMDLARLPYYVPVS